MKNTQTHSAKTFKKVTHINVRHVSDSEQYIPVLHRPSTEYDARHKSGGGTGNLKPQANPPDESSRY